MEKKGYQGLLAIVLTAVIALIVIWGVQGTIGRQTDNSLQSTNENPSANGLGSFTTEKMKLDDADKNNQIIEAFEIYDEKKNPNGFLVNVKSKGYGGDMVLSVSFREDGKTVRSVDIKEHKESPGIGDQVTKADFLNQFKDMEAPITLKGNYKDTTIEDIEGLVDGVYESESKDYDQSGFKDFVKLTVKNGKIDSIYWDAQNADKTTKRDLTNSGSYTMSETGFSWNEQADLTGSYIIEKQGTGEIYMNEEGKTDSISGVSISVSNFIKLVKDALAKAEPNLNQENEVDSISGATISSKAVLQGINTAVDFLANNIKDEDAIS